MAKIKTVLRKSINIVATLVIMVGLVTFLAALYVGVDPDSELSGNLRKIPILSSILKDKSPPGGDEGGGLDGSEVQVSKYQSVSGMEVILEGTSLYSNPREDAEIDKKIEHTGRYKIVEKRGEWIRILYKNKPVWVSPKRKNLRHYKPSEQERRAITGDIDLIDLDKSIWYNELVQDRIDNILSLGSGWKKRQKSLFTLYYLDERLSKLVDPIDEALQTTRSLYKEMLSERIYLHDERINPVIFLLSGKSINFRNVGFHYSLGIISINMDKMRYHSSLINCLQHEYTHHLNRTLLRLGGVKTPPLWLDEGLAEYFANRSFKIYIDRLCRKGSKVEEVLDEELEFKPAHDVVLTQRLKTDKLSIIKKKYKYANQLSKDYVKVPFTAIFDDESWKRSDKKGNEEYLYAWAWMTVMFLLDGEDGKYRDGFFNFLDDIRKGKTFTERLYDYLPIDGHKDLERLIKKDVM